MATDPGTDSNDFEHRFSMVLGAAEQTIGRSNMVLQETLLPNVQRHSMPEIPVWRLHLAATSTFVGIIQCLRTRTASLGAFSLLRGMIEAWTHLFFIADESEPDSPALRAIRFEAGVLSEWASVKKKMNPELDYAEIMRRDHEGVMKLWIANGGKGEPKRRTYKDVNRTLGKMAKSPELESLEIIHASSSVAVHMSAADFLLESNALGVTVIWASEARRCAWLRLAIICFDYLTTSALASVPNHHGEASAQDLRARWLAIYNDPLLAAAVADEDTTDGRMTF